MSGADIIAALALGADFTLIGRAYLYGLMAGGRAGVDRALEILEKDMGRTMALLGVSRVSELTPDHVRILRKPRPAPNRSAAFGDLSAHNGDIRESGAYFLRPNLGRLARRSAAFVAARPTVRPICCGTVSSLCAPVPPGMMTAGLSRPPAGRPASAAAGLRGGRLCGRHGRGAAAASGRPSGARRPGPASAVGGPRPTSGGGGRRADVERLQPAGDPASGLGFSA